MDKIIITTTNSIENATIEKYLGVVTSNLVIGTGFFSDFTASFSDFFGGLSGTYRKQMDALYKEASEAISMKAIALGANCILGFKIDFDEISGKGKSMFMVSVSGTAVKISQNNKSALQETTHQNISADKLNIEYFKYNWTLRNTARMPSNEDWNFIQRHNLTELAPSLYELYIRASCDKSAYGFDDPIFTNFPQVLSNMEYNDAINVIYEKYEERHYYAFPLIKENRLFNPQKTNELIEKGYADLASDLLRTEKDEYTPSDIKEMEELLHSFENLPDKGKIQEVKSGILSSKMVDMYICPSGHKNNKDRSEFCAECGLNIKGLRKEHIKEIERFKTKVSILKNLIK